MPEDRRQVFYVNAAAVEVGPYDLKLSLGMKKRRDRNEFTVDDFDVDILMSHEHARSLLKLLSVAVEKANEIMASKPEETIAIEAH